MYVHCAASGRLNWVNTKFTEYRTSPNMKIKASDTPNLFLKTILFLWGNDSKFDRGRMGLVRYFKKIPSWTEPNRFSILLSSVRSMMRVFFQIEFYLNIYYYLQSSCQCPVVLITIRIPTVFWEDWVLKLIWSENWTYKVYYVT